MATSQCRCLEEYGGFASSYLMLSCTDLHGFVDDLHSSTLQHSEWKIARWQTIYHQVFLRVSFVEATQSSGQYKHGVFI